MRRIASISLAIVMLAIVLAGCAGRRNPTPTPTLRPTEPVATPTDIGGTGTAGNAGGVSTRPNTGTAGTTGTRGTIGSTGTQYNTVAGIPNFRSGTEVHVNDVPDIRSALQDTYEGASISRITHGMHGTDQVYVVNYTWQDTLERMAYIRPDGRIITTPGIIGGP